MNVEKVFLIIAAMGLAPLGLMYGVAPEQVLGSLFSIEVSTTNGTHIFRAMMTLYLGFALFWLVSAFKPCLHQAALISLTVFMYGIASGRIISVVVDGLPHWFFLSNIALELLMGTIGLLLVKKAFR
jgi:uncharacterized membrane protein YhdT